MIESIGTYVETAALFAVMSDDRADAERLVRGLSLSEAEEFARQVGDLRDVIVEKIVADRDAAKAAESALAAQDGGDGRG